MEWWDANLEKYNTVIRLILWPRFSQLHFCRGSCLGFALGFPYTCPSVLLFFVVQDLARLSWTNIIYKRYDQCYVKIKEKKIFSPHRIKGVVGSQIIWRLLALAVPLQIVEQKTDDCLRVSWQRGFPTQVDVANTERALQEMRGLISSMQQEIAAAVEEKRRRDEEEERQKQTELLKKEQMKAQTPAPAQQSVGKQQKEGWFHLFSPYTLFHC